MQTGKRKKVNLRATHPALLILYFFSAIVFSMLTLNPAYLLISFIAALCLNFYLEGVGKTLRFLRYFVPVHLLLVLANALFSGNGLTVIFYLRGRPVTLESIVFGFAAGLMLLTILLWFRAYQEVSSSDQIIAMGGKRFPQTSLLLGMILRYVPDTLQHGQKVKMSQNALVGTEKLPRKERLAFYTRMSTVLMSWSMENALDTSIAMRAKGFPSEQRSSYKRERFSSYDAVGVAFLLLMILLQIVGYARGLTAFQYYPILNWQTEMSSELIVILTVYALFLFFPFYVELADWWSLKKIRRAEEQFSNERMNPWQAQESGERSQEKETIVKKKENAQRIAPRSEYQSDCYDSVYAVELEDLSFTYPNSGQKALDNLSLRFERGSLILLTGASGSGKTTLLRVLAPVLTPAGELNGNRIIYGEEAASYESAEKTVQIGFVQQNPDNQIILDSVWHELAFGLENKGLSQQDIERRLAETSTFFGISDWMDRKVSELSGGEKQILNLASSLVMQPDLLLLDEPIAQLDPISRKRFLSLLGRVHDETGTTIVISEHVIDDILPHADSVIQLEAGAVSFSGGVEAYLRHLTATDDKFQISIPLSARMVAQNGAGSEGETEAALPLTVRAGRQFLQKHKAELATKPETPTPTSLDLSQRTNILEARDLWFRYEKDAPFVLRGASLTIKEGELHALLGGNGSGKSTLMYILSRSLPALRGKIVRAPGQEVAMLNQNPMSVFSQDSVRAELMEFRQRFSYDESDVNSIMERLNLTHLAERHPYDLSGGEMQKTALAKALLTKPNLLLLDEPVKGLDPVARRELSQILVELKESGMTMILITHDLDFISQLADRCSLIFDGRLEGTADSREFFADNAYFTTTARRLSKGILPDIVTEDDLLERLRSLNDRS